MINFTKTIVNAIKFYIDNLAKNIPTKLSQLENDESYVRSDDILQSDWDQNDSTAKDYIKNRTHYDDTASGGELKKLDKKFLPDEIVAMEFGDSKYVRFDESQELTEEQKEQARTNIGVGDHKFFELILTDKTTGYDYIVSMINGKIVYSSLCTGIYIAQNPSQIIYANNDTFNPNGMIVAANCEDGTIKEITGYTYSDMIDGQVTITYVERGNTYTTTFNIEIISGLEDFYYTSNGDGTVTITGWKGTLNGEPSTEMVFPDDPRVIL